MDSIQKGVEALRKTLEDFTEKTFVYANQEVILDYPIGVVTRLSEIKLGQTIKRYVDEKEVLIQVTEVPVQIDYISPFSRTSAKDSLFSSRDLLSRVQAGYYSAEWQNQLRLNKEGEDVEMSVLNFEDLTGPIKVEGSENLWSARVTATLIVLNERRFPSEGDFPCITEEDNFPLNVKFDLKGKKDDSKNLFVKVCDEDNVKSVSADSDETFAELEESGELPDCPTQTP